MKKYPRLFKKALPALLVMGAMFSTPVFAGEGDKIEAEARNETVVVSGMSLEQTYEASDDSPAVYVPGGKAANYATLFGDGKDNAYAQIIADAMFFAYPYEPEDDWFESSGNVEMSFSSIGKPAMEARLGTSHRSNTEPVVKLALQPMNDVIPVCTVVTQGKKKHADRVLFGTMVNRLKKEVRENSDKFPRGATFYLMTSEQAKAYAQGVIAGHEGFDFGAILSDYIGGGNILGGTGGSALFAKGTTFPLVRSGGAFIIAMKVPGGGVIDLGKVKMFQKKETTPQTVPSNGKKAYEVIKKTK